MTSQSLLTLPVGCFHSIIQFLDYVPDGGDAVVQILRDRHRRTRARAAMRRAINVSVITTVDEGGYFITAYFANGVLHRIGGPAYSSVRDEPGTNIRTSLFVVAGIPSTFIRRGSSYHYTTYEVAGVEFAPGTVCTEQNAVQMRYAMTTTYCPGTRGRTFGWPALGKEESLRPITGGTWTLCLIDEPGLKRAYCERIDYTSGVHTCTSVGLPGVGVPVENINIRRCRAVCDRIQKGPVDPQVLQGIVNEIVERPANFR